MSCSSNEARESASTADDSGTRNENETIEIQDEDETAMEISGNANIKQTLKHFRTCEHETGQF